MCVPSNGRVALFPGYHSVEVVSKQPEAASLTTHSAVSVCFMICAVYEYRMLQDVNIDQHVALEPLPPEGMAHAHITPSTCVHHILL